MRQRKGMKNRPSKVKEASPEHLRKKKKIECTEDLRKLFSHGALHL